MTDSANISINKPIFNTITHVQSEVVAEEDNEDNEENDDQIIEDNQNDIKVVEHFATDSNLIKKYYAPIWFDSSRHEEISLNRRCSKRWRRWRRNRRKRSKNWKSKKTNQLWTCYK